MQTIVVLLSLCAPAPLPRVKPVLQVTPGDYVLHWGGTTYTMHLNEARGYNIPPLWWGTWHWDERSRTLTVKEQSETSCVEWTCVLDRDLKGEAKYGHSRPAIRLEKKP